MKDLLFNIYINFFKLLFKIFPIKKGKICILNRSGYSGSNAEAMYQYIKKQQHDDIFMLNNFPSKEITLKQWYHIARSQIILCSHEPFKISKKQICIELWHGIPLKRMGYLANNTDIKGNEKNHKKWQKIVDIVISSSALYETMMSATLGIDNHKFKRTGFPRNDYFFQTETEKKANKAELIALFEKSILNDATKILFYLPTFRIADGQNDFTDKLAKGNFLGFDDYDAKVLNDFLTAENIVLIAKLHPNEEAFLPTFATENTLDHIKFMSNDWLKTKQKDLYAYLAVTDGLITDYSSVFFDYLLLNKPEFFTVQDLTNYRDTRGFFVEPYEFIAPGAKAKTLSAFKKSITDNFSVHDAYQTHRETVKQLVYDEMSEQAGAAERIWQKIVLPIMNQ